MTIPIISLVPPYIHSLSFVQGGGEDLTSILQRLKVIRSGLDGVRDPKISPINTPGDTIEYEISQLIPTTPQQYWEKVTPYFLPP